MGRDRVSLSLLAATVAAAMAVSLAAHAAEPASSNWKLVWSDEFDGEEIDRTKWDFDLGNGFYAYDANMWISGWGNEELQYYTKEPGNASVKDGMLRIRAIKESLHGCGYTSARLRTSKRDRTPLFDKKYGRFEIRAKLPTGQGIWPAIWMMPQEDKYGTWASSGEIDIMEARGQQPTKVLGSTHYGSRWPAQAHTSNEFQFPAGSGIGDFHVYALEWEPGRLRWYVDGKMYAPQSFWWSSSKAQGSNGVAPADESELNPWPAPFDRPFYLILNLAVGGKFPGNPDKTTRFPAEMLVDYVRVYDKKGGYGPVPKRGDGKLTF